LVKLQKQHSKQWKKWTEECQNLGGKCEAIYEVNEMIFELLEKANSVNNDLIQQNDNLIKKLTKVYKSIPKKEQTPSLKSKLEQEHKNVKQIKENRTELIKELTKQQTQRTKELDAVKIARTNLCLDKSEKDELRRQHKHLFREFTNTNQEIERANEECNQATNSYTNKAKIFLKNSQRYQTKSLDSMENILQNFINVLKIESSVSNRTTQKIKPSKKSIQSKKQNRSSSTDDERSVISIDSD
jgi:hypothetical protein